MSAWASEAVPAATDSQVLAADPTRSVWVTANAGTGKTHVLIDRITRLLLAGTPAGKILCLTFTKAAAAEMANRLNARLGEWAILGDADLDHRLRRLLGTETAIGADQRERARRLFAETLEEPEGLKIRTIHAFCESLLGRFPLEANVAPNFTVIDERSSAELRLEARDRMLAGASDNGDRQVTRALAHLAALVDERRFAEVMAALDKDRGRLAALLERHGSLEGVLAAVRRGLGLDGAETAATVLAQASADGAFDREGLARAALALERGSDKDRERAEALRAWLGNERSRAESFGRDYVPLFLRRDGAPRAGKTLITKGALASDPGVLDVLLAEQERVLAVVNRLKAVATAEATESLLRIGKALLDAYRDMKEARALIDYDDLILKAQGLLRQDGGASWVHYKLDGGIDHILVDEAQDTSPAQWEVIRVLAEEFFAGEGAAEAVRTVFAVGDEKQSIYSFQGADPREFERMREHFEDRTRACGGRWQTVELAESFRSARAILEAVDKVFANPEAADGLTSAAEPLRHRPTREGQAGLVELWPTVKAEPGPQDDPWDAPLDRVSPASPAARLARRIADMIQGWLSDGEILESAGRAIVPGDVLILVRKRSEFAEEMVKVLKQRNIPVAGADRMRLTEQLAVMDLMALGRFLLLAEDDLTLAVVLKGPLFGFDDDALFRLAYGRRTSLWEALGRRRGEEALFEEARARLSELRAEVDFTAPYDFFARVLGPLGGRRKLVARLGPEANDPLDEFLGLALDYERDHVPSLQGFLHWLEAGETEIKRDLEHGRGEVRVMTVHGAKGLQSNVVILPDTCSVPRGIGDVRLYWRDAGDDPAVFWPVVKANEEAVCAALAEEARRRTEEEYRRLLYVAMTRARDRLYIGGWEREGRPQGCWYDLVAEALRREGDEVALPFGEHGWRLSNPQTAAPDGADEAPIRQGAPALPDWAKRPPAPEPPRPRPLVPSRPVEAEPAVRSPFGPDDGSRFKRGRLIHRLLQSLPGLAPRDRAAAARAWLARQVHDLGPDEQVEIAREALAVLDDPGLASLFAPGSHAEVPLVGEVAGHVISARVDRLVVDQDAVTVVDYKTNRPPPQTPDKVPEAYLRQMAAYREALRRVYPDRPVRCLLLWTDGPRLMALDDRLLDRHAP